MFCEVCGTSFRDRKSRTRNERPICQECGDNPIDIRALLCELGLSEDTHRLCSSCGAANCFSDFCFRCGERQ